jgi:hypothetical protein
MAGSNQNPFGNAQSLEYTGGSDPNNKNYSKLSEKLNEADIERRKIQEEAERRERAAEIRREERLAKIQYMRDMPDTQPAGTGESGIHFSCIYPCDYALYLIIKCFNFQLMSSCSRKVCKTNLTS